jgi:hypothetical protein
LFSLKGSKAFVLLNCTSAVLGTTYLGTAANKARESLIILHRKRGKFLGDVEAADAKAAIEEAIKEFEVEDPRMQKRLVAQRAALSP